MIRPLRQRHRLIVLWLAVLLPAAFVTGLLLRKPVLTADAPTSLPAPDPLWTNDHLFTNAPVAVRLLAASPGHPPALSLTAPAAFLQPDLLVYWLVGATGPVDPLPATARLLGEFSSGPFALPPEPTNGSGRLVLYSLADQEIIAVSQPFRCDQSAP